VLNQTVAEPTCSNFEIYSGPVRYHVDIGRPTCHREPFEDSAGSSSPLLLSSVVELAGSNESC